MRCICNYRKSIINFLFNLGDKIRTQKIKLRTNCNIIKSAGTKGKENL